MNTTQKYIAYGISICTDCYMFNHYGDDSFSDYVTPEMESDIRQEFDKLGNVIIGDHHRGGDCFCCEAHFSLSPCDICESNLVSDRYYVDIVEMGSN